MSDMYSAKQSRRRYLVSTYCNTAFSAMDKITPPIAAQQKMPLSKNLAAFACNVKRTISISDKPR